MQRVPGNKHLHEAGEHYGSDDRVNVRNRKAIGVHVPGGGDADDHEDVQENRCQCR